MSEAGANLTKLCGALQVLTTECTQARGPQLEDPYPIRSLTLQSDKQAHQ